MKTVDKLYQYADKYHQLIKDCSGRYYDAPVKHFNSKGEYQHKGEYQLTDALYCDYDSPTKQQLTVIINTRVQNYDGVSFACYKGEFYIFGNVAG